MAKDYTLKTPPAQDDTATAITVPRASDESPRIIPLTEDEQRSLRLYIAAQRSIARHKSKVLELIEREGKLSYLDATVTPRQSKTYDYPEELAAEIEAVDEKKKAARDSGAATTNYGAISIDFADKKAKAKKKGGRA
jgi:hypothetical protein